jgi:hypothetical protein
MSVSGWLQEATLQLEAPGGDEANRARRTPTAFQENCPMTKCIRLRSLAALALAFLSMLAFLGRAIAAEARDSGPLGLVITYQTEPANRVALRKQIESADLRQFQKWKEEGVIKDFHVLFSRYVDTANWTMLVFITFATYSDAEHWKQIEQTHPAGLSPKALALTTSIATVPVDVARAKGLFRTRDSVFMVIPYHYLVPTGDYLNYVDDYVAPQLEGWMGESVLAGYGLFLVRYTADRPWESMLLLEYTNDQALGAREAVVAKVRAKLKDNPKWKAISDNKKEVRVEKQAVIADALAPLP